MCEQQYKTRRPLSLWLSLWLYTVPVTLLCRLGGLDVSLGALRWAAFPASTRQLWFISDYLLLLLCVPLLNRLLHGLPRAAHRGVLAVLAVPLLVYPTLFAENGLTGDTAWMFLYEYLLIAYLRRYPDVSAEVWHGISTKDSSVFSVTAGTEEFPFISSYACFRNRRCQ